MKKSILKELGNQSIQDYSSSLQFCGDIDIRIARDGTWYYQGSAIARKKIVQLFSRALKRDKNGSFWLETPAEKCRIRVDDAPFVAVAMDVKGMGNDQSITFITNLGERVSAGSCFPIRVEVNSETLEPAPYVLVRDRLEALISRAVFYDLVELAVEIESEGQRVFGVWSNGFFFQLGALNE